MFKKRWSHLDVLLILFLSYSFSAVLYFIVNFYSAKNKKEECIDLIKSGREIYIGVALPRDVLSGDTLENDTKVKSFFTDKVDSAFWTYFRTEDFLTHKVFVFRTLEPSEKNR